MNIMLTGAGGMLGRALCSKLAAVPGWRLMPYVRSALDVRDNSAVQAALERCEPQVLVHLAAYTDVEKAEQEPDAAYRTNYLGTWYICQACALHGITLIYLSSDLVFDGKKGLPYVETDPPNPLNVYGCSKLAGEQLVRTLVRSHYIIRAGWMFGGNGSDHKFVGKILELAATGKPIQAVLDRIGSPVYTADLAETIRQILEKKLPWGTYHVANKGLCSRYEFAAQILRYAGLSGVTLKPVPSFFFAPGAPRPVFSALRPYALELMGCYNMRPWQEALEEYIMEIRRRGETYGG